MAILAPVAGAVIGGVLTGGAGWAMSAGWLIGSWLFQPDNDGYNTIIDPGAEEMPRFNQALRGVTMPVLFGTNRVSQNIVWQKNFTTIRHESTQGGGGGKGGGSGMGGKGGGPSTTQVTYEYKWDLMFHLGMTDEDFSLFGGWLGAERLNSETLLAIINNSNAGFGAGVFRSDVERPENASLVFEEGFYHGGQASNSSNAQPWDHFESEEGHGFRWPFTCYIGFKQLNLGGHAIVPQMSWEIGPGDIQFTFDSAHEDYYNSHTITISSAHGPAGGLLVGDDGKLYHVDEAGANSMFRLRNVTDGVTVLTKTDAQFDDDATTFGLDPLSQYDFDSGAIGSGRIPNTNYILAWGQDIGVGFRSNWAYLIYKVNSSGSLEVVGGYQGRTNSLEDVSVPAIIGIFGEQTEDDSILIMGDSQVGADHEYFLMTLPTINQFQAGLIEDDAANTLALRTYSLETGISEVAHNFGNHESYRPYMQGAMGFFLPTVSIGLLGPEWKTKIFFYIGKSDIEWHIDNPADSAGTSTVYNITGTYPNGVLFSSEMDIVLGTAQFGNFEVENANWIDAVTEEPAIPFSDSGYRYDETTVDDADDYDPSPTTQKLTEGAGAGATLVVFVKNVSPGGDRNNGLNTSTKIQAFLWNPLEQTAKRYVTQTGAFADTDADWGIGAASNYTIGGIGGFFVEDTGEFHVAGYTDGDGATDDVFVALLGEFNIGGGEDVLPPYIIYKILTSDVYGLGISPDSIDSSSYQLALQYCDAEDIRVSTQYTREQPKLQIINALLGLYGGFLIDSGGKLKFGLTTYTDGTYGSVLRTIDNDHLLVDGSEAPVRVTRGARQDTYNKVKVNYLDRNLEYRQNFVEIADEVDIDLHGVRAQEFPPQFVMSEATANKIAIRALWSNLYTRDVYEFKLGPKDADIEPGDVVTLVDSFHPKLQSGKQVRIVEWLEREPLKFDVRAVDDVAYTTEAALAATSQSLPTQNELFGPVKPAADFVMYELPAEFQGATPQVFVGYRQQSPSKGARLYTSADGVSFAQVQEVQPFIISGIIGDALPARPAGFVEENVEVFLMPDTFSGNFSGSSPTYAQTFQLDDVGANGRALGGGLFWINSEMIAYQGVNLLGQNHYRFDYVYRGWGGTHIQGHSSGDTWHKHGGGIFTQGFNEDKIGTIIHYKVAPFNFSGLEYDISSVDARTYQIQGTFFRPQNAPMIQTFVQSPGSYLTVQSEDLGFIARKNVIAGGSPVQFEWYESARARGYGARGYGTGGYGRFEQDTNSVQWRVEVLSSDLATVVRCTSVDTPAFLYSVDANSTDFNGWNGDFVVQVTPFNEFGDSLRTQVKTLELFE